MGKKLGAFLLTILSSVLLLCGCDDPYKNFALSVSTKEIVLYLDSDADNAEYPSTSTFNVKVSGTSKSVGGDITITQHAYNGVDDIVSVEAISDDTTSSNGATYRVSAIKAGKGVISINTNEGNKREEIVVTVYVPVKGVEFKSQPIAVKYKSYVDLTNFINFTPESTNQKEMDFYISDDSATDVVRDDIGITETSYARIVNGVLTSKDSNAYPNDKGEKYVNVYGVSKHDSDIRTSVLKVPVLEIVEETNFELVTATETGDINLVKNNLGYYDIVLGHNNPTNPFIYSRNLTLKLSSDYTIDQQYAITTNYNPVLTKQSIFELDNEVEEKSRYDFVGLKQEYPYKSFTVSQVSAGTDILEIYVDRLGYEGLFTITLKVRIIVKDFATELTAVDADGNDAFSTGLVVYNAYGGSSLGTGVTLSLSPNPDNNYKIKINIADAPAIDGGSGIALNLANGTTVVDGSLLDSGTRLYIKHIYDYDTIANEILANGIVPKLVITYTFSLAPTGVPNDGYATYTIEKTIPMEMKLGVTDIRIPSNNAEIKINAVTGKAIETNTTSQTETNIVSNTHYSVFADEDPAEISEIVLATIDDQPADLVELIENIRVLNVDGQQSTINAMSNKYFSIVYKEGPIVGRYNRLVLEPELQPEQARIVLELSTTNNIVKTVTIEIVVPITYTMENADKADIEIHNELEVGSSIYDTKKTDYKVAYSDALNIYNGDFEPSEEDNISDIVKYTTLDELTVAVDSRIGFNLYNYIVLKNSEGVPRITKVNYNSNVTISQNREFYNIEYETVNGVEIPYLAIKKVKTQTPLNVDFRISGYDNDGNMVEFTKTIKLTIIEPITSISISPENRTLYVADSLGSLKEEESKLEYTVTVYPITATISTRTIYVAFDNKVLYSLKNGNTDYSILVSDILSVTMYSDEEIESALQKGINLANKFKIQAILNNPSIESKLNNYSMATGRSIDSTTVLNTIFSNNIVINLYAELTQYNKPTITTKTQLTIKYAKKVEKIIPSISETGLYFDLRNEKTNTNGKSISFNVLPNDAYNKKLIVTVENDSIARISSNSVDKNNRIIGNSITILPGSTAGRTYIRVSAEDCYAIDSATGIARPSSYIDIPIRVADGSKEYPFEIATASEFVSIAEDIAEGNNSYFYVITDSFSVNSDVVSTFGDFNGGINGKFTYNIDGIYYSQQNTIQGLTLDITTDLSQQQLSEHNFGLFKSLGENALIENLILSDVNINLTFNTTSQFNDYVNVGVITGVNKGTIYNSFVNGKINVVSDTDRVNIGGLTGRTQSNVYVEEYDDIDTESNSYVVGSITGEDSTSTFANNGYNSEISIVFKGTEKLDSLFENTSALPNTNIGGIAGVVTTYATHKNNNANESYVGYGATLDNGKQLPGVSIYQYNMESIKTIYNLSVAPNIVSVDKDNNLLPANVGGVVGYSHSTLIDKVEVLPVSLQTYSNVGGIIGYAYASSIQQSVVEFANLGQTGIDTVSITAKQNIGGMVGYGVDVNIAYSYVRAYFNGKAIDDTYYGNLLLLESEETEKNIGGLIGKLDSYGISNQIKTAGESAGLNIEAYVKTVSTTSASAIINSYFNADINTDYQTLSGTVNIGGLIGKITNMDIKVDVVDSSDEKVNSLLITDSYFYGNISQAKGQEYTITNYVSQPVSATMITVGTSISYQLGSIANITDGEKYFNKNIDDFIDVNGKDIIEVTNNMTITEYVDADANKYFVNTITYRVIKPYHKAVGNATLSNVVIDTSYDDLTQEEQDNDTTNNTVTTKTHYSYNINVNYGAAVEVKHVYSVVNGNGFVFNTASLGSNETLFKLGTFETKVVDSAANKTTVSTVNETIYDDLKDVSTFKNAGFDISKAVRDDEVDEDGNPISQEYSTKWLILSDLNSGYPVLFSLTNNTTLLFKVLPTNISINILDTKYSTIGFNNLTFLKDGDNLILFYNELLDSKTRPYVGTNKYKLTTSDEEDNIDISLYPVTAISIDLDIVDLSKYNISAIYDKDMVIKSSDENIVSVGSDGIITTKSTGNITLTISSKLDSSITKSLNILVVNGLSDFNIYKSKNLTTDDNQLQDLFDVNKKQQNSDDTEEGNQDTQYDIVDENDDNAYVRAITQIIDETTKYWTDVVNNDPSTRFGDEFTTYNGSYVKNSNMGVKVEVNTVGEGQATLNNVQLEKGKTYLYSNLGEFNFTGNYKGLMYLTLTPFIKSEVSGFGTTLTETASSGKSVDNCVLVEKLKKTYKFNIIPKAESIAVDKQSANLDPVSNVDLTITTVTSNFVKIGEDYIINETINLRIFDLVNNTTVGTFTVDMTGSGQNSSLINVEILDEEVQATNDALKIKLIKKIRLSFNTEMYSKRTNGVSYNLNDIRYRFNFYPSSNSSLNANFDLKIVPLNVNEIKMTYYANSEISGTGTFYPQEDSSNYIVPSRVGLLKLELTPNYSNAEYVKLTVDGELKSKVSFVQQLGIMSSESNGYITGYRTIIDQPEYLPGFEGIKLLNQSTIVNSSDIYFNNWYYVQVFLSSETQVNQEITFRATSYKTDTDASGRKIETEIRSDTITLQVQPLPSIALTVDGKSEGIIAKGATVDLEVSAINFEGDIQITANTLNNGATYVSVNYDETTGKWTLSVDVKAVAGDTAIITATATKFINGVLEQKSSQVRLYIVEYLITGVRVNGTTYADGRYQYEALNGTTHPLTVLLDVEKDDNNEDAITMISSLESEASGIIKPDGVGSYINNWWRLNNLNEYETLYPNVTYTNYRFVDLTMSDYNRTHYYAVKTLSVSSTDVITYRMRYYYDGKGVPRLYTGIDLGYQLYELSFSFVLVIKDNSTYDHPNPISTVAEFMALGGLNTDGTSNGSSVTEGHYILVNDLTLENYYPFSANFSSLDGNGYIIKIKNFNTDKYKNGGGNNIGLFETISANTIIKNVTIDVSDMLVSTSDANKILQQKTDAPTAKIDLMGISSFNFGILAGQNNGSVTNIKVVNTYSTQLNGTGRKNLLVASTTGYLNGSLVDARVGGIVGSNNGTISNSHIGLNASNYDDTSYKSQENHGINVANSSEPITTYPFNLVGGKTISAFANTNSGIIANSYVLGVGVTNTGSIFEGTKTAGFVVENQTNGNIFNSMVEGLGTVNYRANEYVYLEGKGYIGGFVYTNSGKISNAYSNICITTNSGGSGGFVYSNELTGSITNAYSTAKNGLNSWAHGLFTGINDENEYNNKGTYTSCFYLVLEGEVKNEDEPAIALNGKKTEGVSASEASANNEFRDTGSFNGFNFRVGDDNNNVWMISSDVQYGPRLISATESSTYSHRVLTNTTVNGSQTIYDYEYDSLYYYGSESNPLLVNSATEFVTFIINNSRKMTVKIGDETDTLYVFGTTNSSSTTLNVPSSIRLINDLDFSAITLNNMIVDGKRITDITFAGKLDGNGMTMSGIRLVDQNQSTIHENFGLFKQVGISDEQLKSLENVTVSPAIMNVNIGVAGVDAGQSVKVGALTGSMYNTTLINVKLFGGNGVYIRGQNIVGGIAGYIVNTDNKTMVDITVENISVTASHSSINGNVSDVTTLSLDGKLSNDGGSTSISYNSYGLNKANTISNMRRMSYAGSVAGIISAENRVTASANKNKDGNKDNADYSLIGHNIIKTLTGIEIDFDNGNTIDNYKYSSGIENNRTTPGEDSISKITVQGGGYIAAEHAGGLFGCVDEHTLIKNSKYLVGEIIKDGDTASEDFIQEIRGYNYAGGIAGENFGMLEQVRVEYIDSIQENIDKNFNTGNTTEGEIDNLFGTTTSIAIGGIAGYSGSVPNSTDTGAIIVDSYSRVNIVNNRAKAAGGLVGLTAGYAHYSHVITTAKVYASQYIGGLIGLHVSKLNNVYYDLQLDYAFAVNQWTNDVKEIVYDNLLNTYENDISKQHNFKVTMPEIGNVISMSNDKYRAIKISSSSTVKAYVGSLIGASYTNTALESSIWVSSEPKIVETRKVYIVNGTGSENSSRRYILSTVISTTFNDQNTLINNVYNVKSDNEKYTAEDVGAEFSPVEGDYTNAPTGINEAKATIGNQLKLDVIFGTNGTNNSLFNMFIWDAISLGTDLSKLDSKLWKLGDLLPEYIVGIYSNYTEITNATTFNTNISNNTNTRNKYYLLKNSFDINMSENKNDALVYNSFEGTIIGVQTDDKNPVVTIKTLGNINQPSSIFSRLSNATIMNVDFVAEYSTNSDTLQNSYSSNSQNEYQGFFAKTVSNTVLSNVGFTLKANNSGNVTYSNDYVGIGLMIGNLTESTLQNINVNLDITKGELIFKPSDSTINTKEISFGGVAGTTYNSTFDNVEIINNSNTTIKLQNIRLASDKNRRINVGSLIGKSTRSTFTSVNSTQLLDGNYREKINNVYTFDSVNGVGKYKVNYGGVFGYVENGQMRDVNFKGDINYANTQKINNIDANIGGIVGYGVNSSLEQANVNDYWVQNDSTIERHSVTKTNNEKYSININAHSPVNDGESVILNVGGIIGSGSEFKCTGSRVTSYTMTNGSNINVTSDLTSGSSIYAGGIAGSISNTSDSSEMSKVVNTGDITITETNANSVMIGGIAGNVSGGKYYAMYNVGELNLNGSNPSLTYSIGGVFGQAETNSSQTTLSFSKFINFSDINIKPTATGDIKPSKSSTRFAGGVIGRIIGTASQLEGGYTLSRILYDGRYLGIQNQDNQAINGIAYMESINPSTFNNVFFVFDFLPYSNYSNASTQTSGAMTIVDGSTNLTNTNGVYGGIEYAQLVNVLNKRLNKYIVDTESSSVEFVKTSSVSEYIFNLPTQFKLDNNISMIPAVSLFDSQKLAKGAKLNPYYNDDGKNRGNNQNTFEIDENKFYIFDGSRIDNKTLKFGTAYRGLVTTTSRNSTPTVALSNMPSDNYGVLSNLRFKFDTTHTNNHYGIVDNNFGNIINCITYNVIVDTYISFNNNVATFVYNNAGNIVQSGSTIMLYAYNIRTSGSEFNGFVRQNLKDGFIKDCYTTVSLVKVNSSSTIFNNNVQVVGFAKYNAGVIETSYFAGTLPTDNIGGNVFVEDNSIDSKTGIIRNCYYDADATNKYNSTGDYLDVSTISSVPNNNTVKHMSTVDFLVPKDNEYKAFKYALATDYVPSSWDYSVQENSDYGFNFGYRTIKGADSIPTIFAIDSFNDISAVMIDIVETKTYSDVLVYGITHSGLFNVVEQLQNIKSTISVNLALLTNIDMSKINFAKDTNREILETNVNLSKTLYGRGYTISNLKVEALQQGENRENVGLFSYISTSGKVFDLILSNANVDFNVSSVNVGALAGTNAGTITNVRVVGNSNIKNTSSTTTSGVGGLVGYNSGTIDNSSVNNSIINNVTVEGYQNVGGLVGYNTGKILGSNNTYIDEIDTVVVKGYQNVGGAVGYSKSGVISNISITNDSEISGTKISSELDTRFKNVSNTYTYFGNEISSSLNKSDYTNVGGLIGRMDKDSTLSNPVVKVLTITGHAGVGGMVGYNEGTISSNQRYWTSDINRLKVNGYYVVGGLTGFNSGTIEGSGYTTLVANVAYDKSNYNVGIGGAVGINSGNIKYIKITNSNIYGSRLFGGVVGVSKGGILDTITVESTQLYYNSFMDMDAFEGDMGDSLMMGVTSSNANWTNNNFNKYFGLGGDNSYGIQNADDDGTYNYSANTNSNYYYTVSRKLVVEYGGLEIKVGTNKQIKGKESFMPLFGFISGYINNTNNALSINVNNSKIIGVYDKYKNYIANVDSISTGGWPNKSTISRFIQNGKRVFNIYSDNTAIFNFGSTSYKKYTDEFESYGGSPKTFVSRDNGFWEGGIAYYQYKEPTLNRTVEFNLYNATRFASDNNMDFYIYIREIAIKNMTSNKDKVSLPDYESGAYPGMTIDTVNTKVESAENKGQITYEGKNQWFSPIRTDFWSNRKFIDGGSVRD